MSTLFVIGIGRFLPYLSKTLAAVNLFGIILIGVDYSNSLRCSFWGDIAKLRFNLKRYRSIFLSLRDGRAEDVPEREVKCCCWCVERLSYWYSIDKIWIFFLFFIFRVLLLDAGLLKF